MVFFTKKNVLEMYISYMSKKMRSIGCPIISAENFII